MRTPARPRRHLQINSRRVSMFLPTGFYYAGQCSLLFATDAEGQARAAALAAMKSGSRSNSSL